MIPALMSVLSLVQAADPEIWKELPSDEDGDYVYRLIDGDATGDTRRLVLRATPAHPREWAIGELVYEMSCSARTVTILSVRSMDADGTELQFVAVPEDRRRAETMYAGEGLTTTVHADLCPDGPLLEDRPPQPRIVAVAPGR